MRILGVDYGAKYVGVAVSDPLGIIARPLEAIQRKEENKLRRTFARIEELVKEYDIERIVVGLSKNMDDTEGESAAKCRDFAANVSRRTGIETVLWDERLSSVSANDILIESGISHFSPPILPISIFQSSSAFHFLICFFLESKISV